MKMFRQLEIGEIIQAGDLYIDDNQFMPFVTSIGQAHTVSDPAFRPIPEPTWRKISDGPVIGDTHLVTDGKRVEVGYITASGNFRGFVTGEQFDRAITHYLPIEKPQPPAPEKSAEEIAFDEWFSRTHYLGNAVREAFHAAWTAAKGQR
jgi:hypothetical protein